MDSRTIERFLKKVEKPETGDGCWIWNGATVRPKTHPRPYGQVSLNGKTITAHRAAYLLFVGEVPHGADVCHRCDNARCVNPAHLFTGTRSDNMQDCLSKGRHVTSNHDFKPQTIKLNNSIVLEILNNTTDNLTTLGKRYGVHRTTISDIKRRVTWKEVKNN